MHIDLLGEGEWWFGGLATLAIVILIVFTCKFSVTFAQLYPVETILADDQTIDACHSTIPNAKFTSGLQLLSLLQHEEVTAHFSNARRTRVLHLVCNSSVRVSFVIMSLYNRIWIKDNEYYPIISTVHSMKRRAFSL